MSTHIFRASSAVAVTALTLCLIAGCDQGSSPKLDEGLARTSLTAFLDAWKQGERPAALASQSPEIIVGDPQFVQGTRLVEYRMLDPVANDGSNLHQPVELEIEDGAGVRSKQQVKYIVGTSPKITIFPE